MKTKLEKREKKTKADDHKVWYAVPLSITAVWKVPVVYWKRIKKENISQNKKVKVWRVVKLVRMSLVSWYESQRRNYDMTDKYLDKTCNTSLGRQGKMQLRQLGGCCVWRCWIWNNTSIIHSQ